MEKIDCGLTRMRSETGALSHALWESAPGHGRESLDCGLKQNAIKLKGKK